VAFVATDFVAVGDRDGRAAVAVPVDTPGEVLGREVAAVAGCPASGFADKSHRAVGYTDYTRKVTCLTEIGLN